MNNGAISAVAELAASQHRAFTRTQAASYLTRSQIGVAKRNGWLVEPYPGVLMFADSSPTWRTNVHAAELASGGRAVASHRAAARLHGVDGFEAVELVELSIGRKFRWRYGPPVITHHVTPLEPCDAVVIDGIACTGFTRTLADLGAVVERRLVRRALIDVRRRDVSLGWVQSTVDRLHRPGPSGTGVLLRELSLIPTEGKVSQTWFEELIAEIVSDPSRPRIEHQYELRRDDGMFVARFDLAMPSIRLALEAHSRRFHFGPDAEPLDEQRDLAAAACGWEISYLGWFATKRPKEVLAIVKQIAAARRRERPEL